MSIIGIDVFSIMMIDHVYANSHTLQFAVIAKVFCPYFPISEDFVDGQVFLAIYYTDPITQLDMIHYDFQSVCYKETESIFEIENE